MPREYRTQYFATKTTLPVRLLSTDKYCEISRSTGSQGRCELVDWLLSLSMFPSYTVDNLSNVLS